MSRSGYRMRITFRSETSPNWLRGCGPSRCIQLTARQWNEWSSEEPGWQIDTTGTRSRKAHLKSIATLQADSVLDWPNEEHVLLLGRNRFSRAREGEAHLRRLHDSKDVFDV